MSDDLGAMVVSYAADLSGLTEGAQKAKQLIGGVEQAAQSSSGGFLSGIQNMAGGVLDFGAKLGQTVFGVKNLADAATGLGGALLGPAAEAEQTQTAFQTLLGGTKAAADELSRLNTFAAQTPFHTEEINASAEKLLAFGVNAKDVIPDLTATGDALSSLGKTSGADLQQAVDALGKIQTTGHLTGDSLQQLSDLGINATGILSKQLGVSTDEFRKMVSNGSIPAKTAIDALAKGIEKSNLGSGMAKQAQTASGQMSTLASNTKLALAGFGGPLLKEAEGGLSKLGALVASPSFQRFATTVGTGIAQGLTLMVGGFQRVITIGQGIVSFFQKNQLAADLLVGVLAALAIGAIAFAVITIPPLVVAFGAWAISAGAAAIATIAAAAPFILIGAVIAVVVAGIILAVQHWGDIMHWFQGVFGAVGAWVGNKMSVIGSVMHLVIGQIGQAFSGLGSRVKGIWDGIVGAVKGAINWIIGDINSFIGFIDSIQIHIPSVGVGPIHTPSFDWGGVGIPKIPYLATGGYVQASGLAMIHRGESVIPARASALGSSGGGNTYHFHIEVGGREVYQALADDDGFIQAIGNGVVSHMRTVAGVSY